MYCPSCGTELTQELVYCNRCGANLKPVTNSASVPPAKLVGAAWAISVAIALVTLGGFGMIFVLVMALIARGLSLSGGGMTLIVFTSLIILAIDWLLVRQLSRVLDVPRLSSEVTPAIKAGEKAVPQIAAPLEPVSSVTDHTTRTLEPVRRERKS